MVLGDALRSDRHVGPMIVYPWGIKVLLPVGPFRLGCIRVSPQRAGDEMFSGNRIELETACGLLSCRASVVSSVDARQGTYTPSRRVLDLHAASE